MVDHVPLATMWESGVPLKRALSRRAPVNLAPVTALRVAAV